MVAGRRDQTSPVSLSRTPLSFMPARIWKRAAAGRTWLHVGGISSSVFIVGPGGAEGSRLPAPAAPAKSTRINSVLTVARLRLFIEIRIAPSSCAWVNGDRSPPSLVPGPLSILAPGNLRGGRRRVGAEVLLERLVPGIQIQGLFLGLRGLLD